MSYFDDVDPDNMPRTPVEVLTIMIGQLQDLRSDLDLLYDEGFIRVPYNKRIEAMSESRTMFQQTRQEQKELWSTAEKQFMRSYYDAIELIDRLRNAARETPDEIE